jgi:hypothetical protein
VSLIPVRNTQKAKNLSPVSTIPLKNCLPVSTTPLINFSQVSATPAIRESLPILACLHLKMKNKQNFNLEA